MGWMSNKGAWTVITKPKFEELAASFLLNLDQIGGNRSLKFLFAECIGDLNAVKIAALPGSSQSDRWNLPEGKKELYLFYYLDAVRSGAFERSPLRGQLISSLSDSQVAEAFADSLWHFFYPWFSSCSVLVHISTLPKAAKYVKEIESFRGGLNAMFEVFEYFEKLSASFDLPNKDFVSGIWAKWKHTVGINAFPILLQPHTENLRSLLVNALTAPVPDSEEDSQLYGFEKVMLFDLRPRSAMDVPVPPLLCLEPTFRLRDDTPFSDEEKSAFLQRACLNISKPSSRLRAQMLPVLLRYFNDESCIYDAVDRCVDNAVSFGGWGSGELILQLLALIHKRFTGSLPEQQKYKGKKLTIFDPISSTMLDWKDLTLFAFLPDLEAMVNWLHVKALPKVNSRVPHLSYLASAAILRSEKSVSVDQTIPDAARDDFAAACRLNSLVRLLVLLLIDMEAVIPPKTSFNERAVLQLLLPFCDVKSLLPFIRKRVPELLSASQKDNIAEPSKGVLLHKMALASELLAKLERC
jgi:hypothetical protein